MRPCLSILICTWLGAAAPAQARGPTPGYHPWAPTAGHVPTLDMSNPDPAWVSSRTPPPHAFGSLDSIAAQADARPDGDVSPGRVPAGWVAAGNVVLPAPVASGDAVVDPDVVYAIEDFPGNEYPRKHTLFLNFLGAEMNVGSDNSATNTSILARQGGYPAYTGGEQAALAIAQAVEADVAPYGIRVMYLERPPQIVPYTMEMIGGSWHDVNTDQPAGGVAPTADCGALGQRHVVYTFAADSTPTTRAANTAAQEAGHAWGLDHTLNCNSVMSYCAGPEAAFSSTCDDLCEDGCQGPNSAGCRLTHEEYCGVGNDQQNEDAELAWIFGGNEPDVEPPSARILSPEHESMLAEGSDVDLVAEIGDDYGGYGWRWTISRDDEIIFDEVDFDRNIDDDYNPALKLTQLTAGVWRFTITVQDQYEHVTTDTVVVAVGDVELPADSGTTGPIDTGADTGPATGGLPGADDGGDDDPPDDCACRGGGRRRPAGAALISLLLLGAVSRRRPPRSESRAS
jgi:hypothetical protein